DRADRVGHAQEPAGAVVAVLGGTVLGDVGDSTDARGQRRGHRAAGQAGGGDDGAVAEGRLELAEHVVLRLLHRAPGVHAVRAAPLGVVEVQRFEAVLVGAARHAAGVVVGRAAGVAPGRGGGHLPAPGVVGGLRDALVRQAVGYGRLEQEAARVVLVEGA